MSAGNLFHCRHLTHFSHDNIRKYCKRPFSSVKEMDECLISNWNSVIKKDDIVYHLGDITWGDNVDEIMSCLNGQKFIIAGNHDHRKTIKKLSRYCTMLPQIYNLRKDDVHIVLSHYPLACWNKSNHGSFMLHGHTHGNIQQYSHRIDVGIDCFKYRPVKFSEVLEKAKEYPQFVEPFISRKS